VPQLTSIVSGLHDINKPGDSRSIAVQSNRFLRFHHEE
jgi:hypothetical protein